MFKTQLAWPSHPYPVGQQVMLLQQFGQFPGAMALHPKAPGPVQIGPPPAVAPQLLDALHVGKEPYT